MVQSMLETSLTCPYMYLSTVDTYLLIKDEALRIHLNRLQTRHEKLVLIDLLWDGSNREEDQASVRIFSSYPSLSTVPNSELLKYLESYALVRLDNAPCQQAWGRFPRNTNALSITCGSLPSLARILTAMGVYCSLHDRRSEQGTQVYGISDTGTLLDLKPSIIFAVLVVLHNHLDWGSHLPLHLAFGTLLFSLLLISPIHLDRGVIVYGLLTRNHRRRWSIDLSTFIPRTISSWLENHRVQLILTGTKPSIIGTIGGVSLVFVSWSSSTKIRLLGLALLGVFETCKNVKATLIKGVGETSLAVHHPARAVPGGAQVLVSTDTVVDGHPGTHSCATRIDRTR
ncbi:hypothetical protein GMRT_16088 [Giardia muris]|uniref:Uncharacterized protein n=1 Tax=Giardia muris TaxID=5742 RepID=A0A4Z1SQ11_GIAMU|nr:hypothetical protein GMRT_16088 [Giardia muris]|eukprot:TNJ27922.1 hypothetical protein GMRT_16088 [Giardia muris]